MNAKGTSRRAGRAGFRPGVVGLVCLCVHLAGCGAPDSGAGEQTTIHVWAHEGQRSERKALRQQVERYNARQNNTEVALTFIPSGSYNAQVQAAALAGDLPDALEFDGPFIYSYVWGRHLVPIGDHLSDALRSNVIPSIREQGAFRGALYSLGMYDSGIGLYARRSRLEAAGLRIPRTPETAWTAEEFDSALGALAEKDPDGQVLDLQLNLTGEWYTYAFSPPLQSAGGALIERRGTASAEGVLNSPESVSAMAWFQRWIDEKGYVDPNVDANAFAGGRTALSWNGHWMYTAFSTAFPEDLVLLPLPRFGEKMIAGQGSWNWGVTKNCADVPAAVRFIEFLLEDAQVLEMTRANGAVPATQTAIQKHELYKPDGPLRLFAEQLTGGFTRPRPRTPAYPIITSVFQRAFSDIRYGADVQSVLDRAAREIDQDIEYNHGYRMPDGEAHDG